MKVEHVTFAKVLTPRNEQTAVDPTSSYPIAGVYGFGRGLLLRDAIAGTETNYKALTRLHLDDLVYSKVKAFEGAFAVVGEDGEGRYVSPEFPVFRMDGRLHPAYVRHYVASEPFMHQITAMSSGIGARRERVSPAKFLTATIPLPSLPDQRRIATHLDSVNATQTQLTARHRQNQLRPDRLPRVLGELFRSRESNAVPLASLVDVTSETVHPGDDPRGAAVFVGLEHIQGHFGKRSGGRAVHDETGRKFRFEPGDITFGYLRPYQNKVWHSDMIGLCSVEQFVLRPREGVNGELLAHILRSDIVLDPVNDATNSLQLPRLKMKTLLSLPVPNLAIFPSDLLTCAQQLTELFVEADLLQRRRTQSVDALLPAARNEVFSALR